MEAVESNSTEAGSYVVDSFEIVGLWGGSSSRRIPLGRPVNILIGPNASGKTTIINLLRCALQVDVPGLLDVIFSSLKVVLKDQTTGSRRTIHVRMEERMVVYQVSKKTHRIPVDPYAFEKNVPRAIRARISHRRALVLKDMGFVAGLVWLPVSRRLPVSEDINDETSSFVRASAVIESVDHRLGDLLADLARYRSTLDTQMSHEYKSFEREVLAIFLYDKSHDRWNIERAKESLPKEEDKQQLVRAFEVANLLTPAMRRKIDEHFREANAAFRRITDPNKRGINANDAFFMPLVSRTKAMIQLARSLEERRRSIFDPLSRFVAVTNTFFNGKTVAVTSANGLEVYAGDSLSQIKVDQLSSGEKQLLILLIQALLRLDQASIYIADEPELSLHVIWQERLLSSLRSLGRNMQLIVATHSPDIVGEYSECVFDVSES